MTAPSRHQDWADFSALVESGHPAVVVVPGEPRTIFFCDPGGTRIGIRVVWAGDVPTLHLHELSTAAVSLDGERYLEVASRTRPLYQELYAFVCSLADRVQLGRESPPKALAASLKNWNHLFAEIAVLSMPAQVGLFGELWLVRRLASTLGWEAALNAWKGPSAGEHDFALHDCDVEVKSTTLERRIHTIQSISQLTPSPGRNLSLLSLQFTVGGLSGETLAASVAQARAAMPDGLVAVFLADLLEAGWRAEHAQYYTTRFLLRSRPALIPVDASFPRISSDSLTFPDPGLRARVSNLSYDVDVEGLGAEDGASAFNRVVPATLEA